MPEVIIEARGLSCGYGGNAVVHELDLAVEAGEMVALLGANGAGKSTTLLTLAGAIPSVAGTVGLFGAPAQGGLQRRARAGLGFLKESSSVFPSLTVAQNLALGRGDPERVYEIAPILRGIEHRSGGVLSGGQQRILAVARAIAATPRVLLVDELSLGLAPLITAELLRLLREQADLGTAILFVEQNARTALAVADRAVVLRRGEKVVDAPAAELRPRLDELHDLYFGAAR
jgi:branched-chain amino acid transport system ATP-binding protein